MKKRNVILQAAIASAFLTTAGSVFAATAVNVTSVKYAAEQFSGSTPYATIASPTFSVISGTSIPAGSVITVVVELTGATFSAAQTAATSSSVVANTVTTGGFAAGAGVPTCSMGSSLTGSTAITSAAAAPTATSANTNVVSCQFTSTQPIGIGGTALTINTPSLAAAGLASTSATVTAIGTILVGTVNTTYGAAVPTTGTLEAPSSATTTATSAAGVVLTGAAGTAGKIDLTATPVGAAFTGAYSTAIVDLGSVTATNGTAKMADNSSTYTIQNKGTTTMVATVTAPAGFFAAMKASGTITLNASTCGAGALATSALFASSAAAAAAASVSTAAATPVTGVPYRVCMTIPAASASSVALVPGTPTLTATLGAVAAQDSAETLASLNLWALAYNGSTYDVRNYVPAAATGYNTFVRVINTGSIAAPISVALIPDATGTGSIGTAGVVITSLAAGAATNLTPQQIEAVTGAVATTSRPRLRFTAPTNGLNVQTFLAQPNGTISDMSGAQ